MRSKLRAEAELVQGVGPALGIERVFLPNLLQVVLDLIGGKDLVHTLADKKRLEPLTINPDHGALESIQLDWLYGFVFLASHLSRSGDYRWVRVRVSEC